MKSFDFGNIQQEQVKKALALLMKTYSNVPGVRTGPFRVRDAQIGKLGTEYVFAMFETEKSSIR